MAAIMGIVLAGDFNSKSSMWGSPITDARREYLMKWAVKLGLNVSNSEDAPTFDRRQTKS